MGKKHDENQDLKSLARIAKITRSNKHIAIGNKSDVGIHTWGRIDFLRKYCGWSISFGNEIITPTDGDFKAFKEKARSKNTHDLSNKNVRKKKAV